MGNCFGAVNDTFSSHLTSDATKDPHRTTHLFAHPSPKVHGYSNEGKTVTLPTPRSEGDILSFPHLKAFTFNDLKITTRNFHPDAVIGQGGFGNVYKGWIDKQSFRPASPGSGMVVAVKKLKPEGFQGHKEWLSELNYLGQLHHPNLVKLIGYCLDGDNRLLVYEYMPKGSLENRLFCKDAPPLPWTTRIKVAIGAAQGLTFLHDSKRQVIYRDFKSSNILLDLEFNAKLSDFGLAKAGPTGDNTHVSTQVLGTRGYTAPEYIATGHLTARCDVYSFGVVLLELLSGHRAVDKTKSGVEHNLVDWARPYLSDRRKLFRIMDTNLEGRYPQRAAYATAILALQCIGEAKFRPQMSEVLATLEQLPLTRHSASHISAIEKSPLRHNHHSTEQNSVSGHISDICERFPWASPAKSAVMKSQWGRYNRSVFSLEVDTTL